MTYRLLTLLILFTLLSTVCCSSAPKPPPSQAELAQLSGVWKGAIELPGKKLFIRLRFRYVHSEWRGSMDIRAQSLLDHPLSNIDYRGSVVSFELDGVPGFPRFSGRLEGDQIRGDFSQSRHTFPFKVKVLKRTFKAASTEALADQSAQPQEHIKDAKSTRRPQHPKPPFPYRSEEVTYRSQNHSLVGTLTLPSSPPPYVAMLLISGSGPQDRDSTLMGHKPFLVLADHLTRAGIAVLRVDDRGVGKSTGVFTDATTKDFASDALAGISYLVSRPEIDPDHIGVIGHSEGGSVALLAAQQSKTVSRVILLGAPAMTGAETAQHQYKLILKAKGAPEAEVDKLLAFNQQILDLIKSSETKAIYQSNVVRFVDTYFETLSPEDQVKAKSKEQMVKALMSSAQLFKWKRFYLRYDPRDAIRALAVPTLVLNGERDTQVDPRLNLPIMRRELAKAPTKDVTVKMLKGLNHLFQTSETGQVDEYAQIEETMNSAVLTLISTWIKSRIASE